MSQSRLARAAGIPAGHLSMLESGERENPGVLTLAKIVAVTGTSVDGLLAEAGLIPEEETARMRDAHRQARIELAAALSQVRELQKQIKAIQKTLSGKKGRA